MANTRHPSTPAFDPIWWVTSSSWTRIVNDTSLTPLDNDFPDSPYGTQWHCGQYLGPGRITSVSPTAQASTVTIVDGTRLIYTPPEDFVGQDRFTYSVDGVMQAPVTVNVIRRVRDDAYRVDVNSNNNLFPVRVNDLLGADYVGAGVITNATATAAGGAATIAENGKSIVYTPPANFEGLGYVYLHGRRDLEGRGDRVCHGIGDRNLASILFTR